MEERREFQIFINNSDGQSEELAERQCRSLAAELIAIPEVEVLPSRSAVDEDGAKALDGNLVGLIVALGGAGAAIPTALTVLRDWLVRQRPTTSLTIKTKNVELQWSGPIMPDQLGEFIQKLN